MGAGAQPVRSKDHPTGARGISQMVLGKAASGGGG